MKIRKIFNIITTFHIERGWGLFLVFNSGMYKCVFPLFCPFTSPEFHYAERWIPVVVLVFLVHRYGISLFYHTIFSNKVGVFSHIFFSHFFTFFFNFWMRLVLPPRGRGGGGRCHVACSSAKPPLIHPIFNITIVDAKVAAAVLQLHMRICCFGRMPH